MNATGIRNKDTMMNPMNKKLIKRTYCEIITILFNLGFGFPKIPIGSAGSVTMLRGLIAERNEP